MRATFKNVVIVDTFKGVSKKGNDYGSFTFFHEGDIYRIFLFGDDELEVLDSIVPKTKIETLSLELVPDSRGGVRLRPMKV